MKNRNETQKWCQSLFKVLSKLKTVCGVVQINKTNFGVLKNLISEVLKHKSLI